MLTSIVSRHTLVCDYIYCPQSLGQGNVFTGVCPQGGVCLWVQGVSASKSGGCASGWIQGYVPPGHTHTSYWNAFLFRRCVTQLL